LPYNGINNDYFIDFKEIDSLQNEDNFLFIKTCSVDSSFCFKDMNEVNEFQDRDQNKTGYSGANQQN
jgi:hypothetical protein